MSKPPLLLSSLLLLFACSSFSAPAQLAVYVLGDMEKPTGNEAVVSTPQFLSADGKVTLHSAGNEVIGFQILLQASKDESGLDVHVSDFVHTDRASNPAAASDPVTSKSLLITAHDHVDLFLAHYVRSQDASYDWFPPASAGVLPWRGLDWPDALMPFVDPYSGGDKPVAVPFSIKHDQRRNQAVWIDVFVPKGQKPGVYQATLDVLQNGKALKLFPVALTVHPFDLPDENHVDGYGEIYREAGEMFDSGVKFKDNPTKDWIVYKRYLQMAHAHRFLATHRAENGPFPRTLDGKPADASTQAWGYDWKSYTPYVGKILSGEVFTTNEGYSGPSPGVGPTFFPTPFLETFYGADALRKHMQEHGGGIDPALLETWRNNAERFWQLVTEQGWSNVRFFAYILDEVDGEQDTGAAAGLPGPDTLMFHKGMKQIQTALDAGAGAPGRIHLLWTSHADPAKWVGTPADLRGTISWWSPNGHALSVPFFKALQAQPAAQKPDAQPKSTVWFYHSGQPAIGNHTINQLGIDLRLWGLLCWRYDLNGSFWWSMMDFNDVYSNKNYVPYDMPQYKTDETRWGNGVLFYPGGRLTQIGGQRDIAGPIPSMRMQAYRRGLQDYEYLWLAAQKGKRDAADALIKKLIPAAFSEAPRGIAKGNWSRDPADYYAMREALAKIISGQ